MKSKPSILIRFAPFTILLLLSIGFLANTGLDRADDFLPNELNGLITATGLDVQLMASEPMLKNPTNIFVDDRGRVWVTEAYNYRFTTTRKPTNPDGDRIVILEDSNGDGVMDKSTLFYQGAELNAPLGICVLGNKVIVSQSPYVWAFYDDNGDSKADRKEIIFQGIGGEQHDHGVHSFTFGADGKLYFNFGNAGVTLKDKNGNVVIDQDGDEIGPKKYKQGMVFRCEPDGSKVEVLAENFRNIFEVAVDSYGGMWQSDNDDDGNKSTRIVYVMDYGKYGYTDELTGASWRVSRTNMESEIPLQHWHLNDPGVVPVLLATGAGSPSGMLIYEGKLLPAPFQNQMIHAEPGNNVVRAYPVTNQGAGYTATVANILKGETDQWFRPSDVAAAPDGSLIVADWYDPAVGGHQAGDLDKGRLYRVAPTGRGKYVSPAFDYSTAKGAVIALQNPNLAARYKAWMSLYAMGNKAVPELEKLWKSKTSDSRMRARALWVLAKMPGQGSNYIQQAIIESDPNLRIAGLRVARQLNIDIISAVSKLINDTDPQVLRECAIALHHNADSKAADLWASLAIKNTGNDRWYIEALGIGADRQWDQFFSAYLTKVGDPTKTAGSRDIVWRARTPKAVPYIAALASDKTVPLIERLRYFRAFEFNPGETTTAALLKMLEANSDDAAYSKLILRNIDPKLASSNAVVQASLKKTIPAIYGTPDYIELVNRFELKSENANLLKLAVEKTGDPIAVSAATSLFQLGGALMVNDIMNGTDVTKKTALLTSVGGAGTSQSLDLLQKIAFTPSYDLAFRKQAATLIGRSRAGRVRAQQLIKDNAVPSDVLEDVKANSTGGFGFGPPRQGGDGSAPVTLTASTQSSSVNADTQLLSELLALNGSIANGKGVYQRSCFVCHQVNDTGLDFGPKLSEIGSKLPKESLLANIIHPSQGISFGFETWELSMKDGSTVTGIITSKTETDIDIKFPGGATERLKTNSITSMKELKTSLMPEGLNLIMSKQELADLLEYLSSLKKS